MPPTMRYQPDEARVCNTCHRFKRAELFPVRQRNPDGTVRVRHNYCKKCGARRIREARGFKQRKKLPKKYAEEAKAARRRERYRERMNDPAYVEKRREWGRNAARRRLERARVDDEFAEQLREIRRRYYGKKQADPAAHAENLIDRRIRSRSNGEAKEVKANGRERDAVDAYDPDAPPELVPLQPFSQWLRETFPDATPEEVSIHFQRVIDPRQADRYLSANGRKQNMPLELLDHILTHGLGRPDVLSSIYPT